MDSFEKWAISQGMDGILWGKDANGFYKSDTVNFAYAVWQAARADIVVELPNSWIEHPDEEEVMSAYAVQVAIQSQGVGVK